jgi:hypothetical protein
MKETIIYKKDLLSGDVIREKGRVHQATTELADFKTRMRQELYRQECEKGSHFQVPGFKKSELQKVWGRL